MSTSLRLKVVAANGSIKPAIQGTTTTAAPTRLDALTDVVEGANPTEGSTLVYNVDTDKYIVKQLDLDGGSF